MTNFTRTLALALGLLTGGCAGPQWGSGSPADARSRAPGTTTLRISNNVAPPDELEGVSIFVDGQPLSLTPLPPPGAGPATLGALGLAPGAHTITIRARARSPMIPGPAGHEMAGHEGIPGGAVSVVGAHQPFLVERGPAAITIDVRTGVPGSASAAPLAVSLTMLGGRMAPELGVAPPDGKDERCAALLPVPRALCRAAVDLEDASRRNDVVAALCLRDKLAEMRKLAVVGETGKGDSVAMVEAQVGALAREVDRCGGSAAVSPGPDGITVTRLGVR